MLKLKLQYSGHLMWRTDSLEKTLMLGKTEGRRRRGWQEVRWLDSITDSMDRVWVGAGNWWWTGKPCGCKESDITEQVNWTELSSSTSPFLPLKTQSNRILGNPLGSKQLCTPSHCCWVWVNTWPKLSIRFSLDSWKQRARNPGYLKSETYKFRWGGAIYRDK